MTISPTTVLWSMTASACLTLGLVHAMVWMQRKQAAAHALLSLTALGIAWLSACELLMMRAESAGDFAGDLRWLQVPVWLILLGLVGFVRIYLRAGRAWLGWVIICLRSLALILNFSTGANLNFLEVRGLKHVHFLGEAMALGVGPPNPWMLVGQLSLICFIVFIVDASISVWRRGDRRQALVTGGSIIVFAIAGTIQAILGFWQIWNYPITASLFFLGVLLVMARDLSWESSRAGQLSEDLRESQEAMRQAAAALKLGEISTSLAHEINQPLAIILSNAQAARRLLAKTSPDLAEIDAILGDIVDEDLRASQVIQRLRASLKRGESKQEVLSLGQIAGEVLHIMRVDLASRGIQLARDIPDDLPLVTVDRIQLQQVILNLILNACDAMAESPVHGRHCRVSASAGDGFVRLSVADRGCGLPVEAERVFQPFFTTKENGLGMGLAICRSIIAAHHGLLQAEPNPPQGTVFHIHLPAAS